MLPSAKGLSFTLCWVSLPISFYLRSKHLCQLCALILTCLPIALVILLYVDNYPWDIHVTSWKQPLKLKSSFVLLQCLYYESIALWVNSYARLIDAWLGSTIHEKPLLYDSVVYSLSLPLLWITSFITYAYNRIDQDYDGMSLQKLSLLSFTYSGRVGTRLGDADTSPTYR